MNETELKAIKEKLLLETHDTQKKINKYSDLCKPIPPENSIGRISRMDAINNKSVVEAALRESEKKLDDLKYVESQINEEYFGLCVKCKTSILIGRILFRPQSKYCVNCAK